MFVIEKRYVFLEEETEFLNIIWMSFVLQGVKVFTINKV
jgi:hypothetical protein